MLSPASLTRAQLPELRDNKLIRFAQDGTHCISGGADKAARMMDVSTGQTTQVSALSSLSPTSANRSARLGSDCIALSLPGRSTRGANQVREVGRSEPRAARYVSPLVKIVQQLGADLRPPFTATGSWDKVMSSVWTLSTFY